MTCHGFLHLLALALLVFLLDLAIDPQQQFQQLCTRDALWHNPKRKYQSL